MAFQSLPHLVPCRPTTFTIGICFPAPSPRPQSPPPASRYLLLRGAGSEEDEQWLIRCSSVPCAPTCSSIPPASPAAAQRYQGRPQPQGQQVPSPAHRRKHLSARSQSNPSLIRGNERNSFGLGCCAEYADGNLQWQPSQAIIFRCEVLKPKIGNLLEIIGSFINLLLFDHRLAVVW